jgi:2-phospho-L-lactate guanylyltransferase
MDLPSLMGLPAGRARRGGCCALVAVKQRVLCKSRLANVLTPVQRVALVRSMLAHVLEALAAAQTVNRIVVVSPERDTVPAHIPVLADRGAGLNAALSEARAAVLGLGARAVLVLAADLPMVTGAEIDRCVRAGRHGFSIAPEADGIGTNALYLAGGAPFEFKFGPDSLRYHRQEAERLGLPVRTVRLPGLEFDVDAPAHLQHLGDFAWQPRRLA